MRNLIKFLILLAMLFDASSAIARGGRTSDDCAPGSTDPDCIDTSKTPGK